MTDNTTTAKTPRNTAGAIAKAAGKSAAAKSERATLQNLITRMGPEIAKALPAHIPAAAFTRNMLTIASSRPDICKCTPESVIASMMVAAQCGLDVGPLGEAYLIPFQNTRERRTDCSIVIGYKGLLNLAYRSGQVESVQAHEVRENDDFSYTLGLHPDLTHVPAMRDRGEIIGFYAVVHLKGGAYLFDFMSKDEVDAHARKYSKAGNSGPWASAYAEMGKKTILRRLLKMCPISTEIMRNIANDETVKTQISPDMSGVIGDYIINENTGEVVAEAEQPEQQPAEGEQVAIDG